MWITARLLICPKFVNFIDLLSFGIEVECFHIGVHVFSSTTAHNMCDVSLTGQEIRVQFQSESCEIMTFAKEPSFFCKSMFFDKQTL